MLHHIISYSFKSLTVHDKLNFIIVWCCILAFGPGKHAIPKWCAGRKWHIPMASNRKRSRGRIKADNMGQGEGPTVSIQSDAPEESDLWTAWQLFPLDDDQTCHSKDWVGGRVGVELLYNSVKTEVRQLELDQTSYRQDVVGKATPGWRGPRSPPSELGSREVADKMQ